jgi:hypothetical protein
VPTRPDKLAALALLVLLAVAFASLAAPVAYAQEYDDDDEFEADVLDFQPAQPPGFSLRNVFAPLTSLFLGGPSYWYDERELVLDSTPSGAIVELFYIRSNFQKMYERTETPVTVILPSRIRSLDRDALRIRAIVPGHRQVETVLKIHTRETKIVFDLDPLPNQLTSVSHRYFSGRGSLTFLTKELLAPRLQQQEDSFAVFMAETGMAAGIEGALGTIENTLISESSGQQLGEDLAVRFTMRPGMSERVDFRSRQAYDAAREVHIFAIDLVPNDGGADSVQKALDALAKLRPSDVKGCALVFDDRMSELLDPGSLSRALEPRGEFTDRYIRAAMRRMGEVAPGGTVQFRDGSTYRPTVPIELDASLSQAGGARGFLALLRTFAKIIDGEHGDEALRSLIAPSLDVHSFADVLERANTSERSCLASR